MIIKLQQRQRPRQRQDHVKGQMEGGEVEAVHVEEDVEVEDVVMEDDSIIIGQRNHQPQPQRQPYHQTINRDQMEE